MKCKVCVLRARGFLYISVGANAILVAVLVILYISQNHIIRKNNDLTQTSERRKAEYQTGHSDVRVSVEDDTVCLGCDYLGKDVTVEQTLYSNMSYSDCGARLCCLRDRGIARLLRQVMIKCSGNRNYCTGYLGILIMTRMTLNQQNFLTLTFYFTVYGTAIHHMKKKSLPTLR